MSSTQPDILVFMSDQHTARLLSCAGDPIVETPNMDALAAAGTRFSSAHTSSPLCVPARCSFMTGRLPSSTGVFTNSNIMPSEVATVAHCCGAAGYETILCGRMHFSGQDQRHGFEKRIMGDFTPCIQGRGQKKRADLGPYVCTPAGEWINHYGAGDSPVLAYDRAVIAAALEELAKPHERPLFMVVGTYGPHHTFVAPPELFEKYYEQMDAPISADDVAMHAIDKKGIKVDDRLTPEAVRCLRAAYYGLIEQTDRHLGSVRAAWHKHTVRQQRPQLFCYTSDHGEQAGHRGLWGKMSFYDDAVQIPLIISGDGLQQNAVIDTPVSMTDIPVTVCDAAAAPELVNHQGRSLLPALRGEILEEKPVISEMYKGGFARMLRYQNWKYWTFSNSDEPVLFDYNNADPEARNVAAEHTDVIAALKHLHEQGWDPKALQADISERAQQQHIFDQWGAHPEVPEPDRWIIPESSWVLPTLPEPTIG
jgi:choline-sulfatase